LFLSNPGKPILCAHMDWIFDFNDDHIWHQKKDIIYGYNWLNADDRAGIALAVQLYIDNPTSCWLLFTVGEETWMEWATHFCLEHEDFLIDHSFCLVLDRKGAWDILGVNNNYCTQTFQDWFYSVSKRFWYSPSTGILCDADVLNAHINCLNLSVGYDKHHTEAEFINLLEYDNAYKMLTHVLSKTCDPEVYKELPDIYSMSASAYPQSYWRYHWNWYPTDMYGAYDDGSAAFIESTQTTPEYEDTCTFCWWEFYDSELILYPYWKICKYCEKLLSKEERQEALYPLDDPDEEKLFNEKLFNETFYNN
jgi:hypothetical protein